MTYQNLQLSTDERGVATLVLKRPDKHNALNPAMIGELREACAALRADHGVRVVVLTGAGTSFCAGGDLVWMRAQAAAGRASRMDEARSLAMMLHDVNSLPKPVIARVNGQAYGGGLGLMAVADIVLAADHARFGLTEVRLGLIPATIGPYVVARMGEGAARRVFFSGRLFDAAEAQALGLVARTVGANELDAAVDEEIAPFLAAAPGAVARAKALVRGLAGEPTPEMITRTITALADCWETEEAAEGIAAFLDKRLPAYRVR